MMLTIKVIIVTIIIIIIKGINSKIIRTRRIMVKLISYKKYRASNR